MPRRCHFGVEINTSCAQQLVTATITMLHLHQLIPPPSTLLRLHISMGNWPGARQVNTRLWPLASAIAIAIGIGQLRFPDDSKLRTMPWHGPRLWLRMSVPIPQPRNRNPQPAIASPAPPRHAPNFARHATTKQPEDKHVRLYPPIARSRWFGAAQYASCSLLSCSQEQPQCSNAFVISMRYRHTRQ